MKKIIILVAVLFSFTGCSLFGMVGAKDDLTGVLSEQKIGDEYPGSHLLTDENGEVYALNSTVLNMSSQQYLGNKINVKVEYDNENKVYKVSGISVLEVLEKESGKANWTTYMNQTVGFKAKYYDNWELSEDNNVVKFTAPLQGAYDDELTTELPNRDYVSFSKYDKEENVSFTGFVNDMINKNENSSKLQVSDAKIGINQQAATKYSVTGSTEIHFFLERDSYVYEIAFIPEEDFNTNNERTFYEMILEFQFVPFDEEALAELDKAQEEEETLVEEESVVEEQSSIEDEILVEMQPEEPVKAIIENSGSSSSYDYSSFSEFESLPYHFSAKYPASWYYAGTTGIEDGILHKYAFSDESVTDENEFASLKVLSGDLPAGTAVTLPNGKAVKKIIGGDIYFYVKVADRVYSVQGTKDAENILMQIAASITPVAID